jgi:hypothetical protein
MWDRSTHLCKPLASTPLTAYVTDGNFPRIPQSARRRKLHVYADQIGLTTEERIEIAQLMLRRDITSWKDLDDEQVDRMLDALEGFLLLTYQLSLRTEQSEDAVVAEFHD